MKTRGRFGFDGVRAGLSRCMALARQGNRTVGARSRASGFLPLSVLLIATLACCGAAPVRADRGKIAGDLLAALDQGLLSRVPVIVQTSGSPAGLDLLQVRLLGGEVTRVFDRLPAFTAELPAAAVMLLAVLPRILRISPDRSVAGCWDYNVATVGAVSAGTQYGVDGRGVTVAVLDSGIRPSEDFDDRVIVFRDFVLGLSQPYDDCGHGTHVAGIVAGSGANSAPGTGSQIMFRGAAPGANLVVLKVLDGLGSGRASRVIAAIDWCIANRQRYNIRVLNLSLGYPAKESFHTDPMNAACQAAVRAGLVVVASAGNKGKDSLGRPVWGGITCPGNDPSVITVGASNTRQTADGVDDVMTTYSSRGPTYFDRRAKPDLVAPGNKIVSVRAPVSFLDTLYLLNQVAPGSYGASYLLPRYFTLSGSSMAAPLVAGAAALVLERNPGLTPNAVRAALTYSARPMQLGLPETLSRLSQGAGVLNVPGALEIASKINPAVPRGSAWLSAPLSGESVQQGRLFPWASELIWGERLLRGDPLARNEDGWALNAVWGDAVNWAANVAWGENVVWGDTSWQGSVIWGDNVAWGDNVVWGDNQFGLNLPILSAGE